MSERRKKGGSDGRRRRQGRGEKADYGERSSLVSSPPMSARQQEVARGRDGGGGHEWVRIRLVCRGILFVRGRDPRDFERMVAKFDCDFK